MKKLLLVASLSFMLLTPFKSNAVGLMDNYKSDTPPYRNSLSYKLGKVTGEHVIERAKETGPYKCGVEVGKIGREIYETGKTVGKELRKQHEQRKEIKRIARNINIPYF